MYLYGIFSKSCILTYLNFIFLSFLQFHSFTFVRRIGINNFFSFLIKNFEIIFIIYIIYFKIKSIYTRSRCGIIKCICLVIILYFSCYFIFLYIFNFIRYSYFYCILWHPLILHYLNFVNIPFG